MKRRSSRATPQVKLLNRSFNILFVSQADLNHFGSDSDLEGYFDGSRDTIYVLETLSAPAKLRTMKHELAHALLALTGLKEFLEPDLEEAICTAFESFPGEWKS